MLIQWKDELVMMICVVWLVGIVFCCCYFGATTKQGGRLWECMKLVGP